MADDWYVLLEGHEHGPMPLSQVQKLVNARIIGKNTQVRQGLKGPWVNARTKGLTLAQEKEDKRRARIAARRTLAELNGTRFSDDWFVLLDGDEHGPMPFSQVQEWAQDGTIVDDDTQVRQGLEGPWTKARTERLMLTKEECCQERIAALNTVAKLPDTRCVPAIIAALGASDEQTSRAAVHAIIRYPDARVYRALAKVATTHRQYRMVESAVWAMGQLRDPRVIPAIFKVACSHRAEAALPVLGDLPTWVSDNTDPAIRIFCYLIESRPEECVNFGKEAVEVLGKIVKHCDVLAISIQGLKALAMMQDPRIRDYLFEAYCLKKKRRDAKHSMDRRHYSDEEYWEFTTGVLLALLRLDDHRAPDICFEHYCEDMARGFEFLTDKTKGAIVASFGKITTKAVAPYIAALRHEESHVDVITAHHLAAEFLYKVGPLFPSSIVREFTELPDREWSWTGSDMHGPCTYTITTALIRERAFEALGQEPIQ